MNSFASDRLRIVTGVAVATLLLAVAAGAQPRTNPDSFGMKIYRVDSLLYPYVQAYFRTFDQEMNPLVNLNERNVGLMVRGRTYDPLKAQYVVQTLRNRAEAVRAVIVVDASQSMKGEPFDKAREAAARFVDSKRPQDEVAILAIRDTKEGYELVSNFERDADALGRRLADVVPDGKESRLYDSIGAAIQLCGGSSQGGATSEGAGLIASCSVVVLSDGKDEGSALSRVELNTRISNMSVPVPIYSLAYSKSSQADFRNLEALSKNSFGKYYLIGEALTKMQRAVEDVQNVLQSDYVLTFRDYGEIDGRSYGIKLAAEYPTGSGRVTTASGEFEANEAPPIASIQTQVRELTKRIPPLPEGGSPYRTAATAQAAAPAP